MVRPGILPAAAFLCLLWLLPAPLQAEVRLTTEVSPTEGSLNDDFSFVVIVEGEQTDHYPTISGGEDFRLTLIGPENQVTIINGEVQQKTRYIYSLTPTKVGTLSTPYAELQLNGEKLTTEPIQVIVKKGQAATPKANAPIILRQSVNKKTVFRGEQVVNTIDLYSRLQIVRASFVTLDFPEFLNYSLGKETTSKRYLSGHEYTLNRIRKALFPLSSGKIAIPSRSIQVRARPQNQNNRRWGRLDPLGRGLLGDFFGEQSADHRVKSNMIELTVMDLPPPPADFPDHKMSSPIVGDLKLDVRYDQKHLKPGEGITIEIEIKSTGNLDPLKTVALAGGKRLKIYDEEPDEDSYESAGRLWTKKTLRLLVVPTSPGKVEISPVRVGFFDPESGKYQIAESSPITLSVAGPPAQEAGAGTRTSVERSEQLQMNSDLQNDDPASSSHLKYQEESTLERLSRQISLSLAILVACLLSLVTLTILLLLRVRKERAPLKQAFAALERGESGEHLRSSLLRYLSLLLHDSDQRESLSRTELRQALRDKTGEKTPVLEFDSILDELDRSLFSGKENAAQLAPELLERVLDFARKARKG